ncbi:hypothetical protein HKX48_006407 [Thoreauomyces humboldtii]|nr:hypothetical protein HKX48_006407 [Thoreauomyces humboldtii]
MNRATKKSRASTSGTAFPKLMEGAASSGPRPARRGALLGTHKDFEAMFAATAVPESIGLRKMSHTSWRTGPVPVPSSTNLLEKLQARNKAVKHTVFAFGGKDWDLNDLKDAALSRTSISKLTPSFTTILESSKFNDFLTRGTLWFVRNLVLERSRSTNRLGLIEIQQTRPSGLSDAAK